MTELRPEWSDDATDVLNDIMEYLLETFGISSVIKLRDEIDDYVNTLLKNPNAGRVEPFLEGRCYVYRSIVINSINKIVYRIDGDVLYIVDIWDMRRSPNNLVSRIE